MPKPTLEERKAKVAAIHARHAALRKMTPEERREFLRKEREAERKNAKSER
jgi:acyl-CoA reductase-like NAD-dependent aldehyde dehydrogenase